VPLLLAALLLSMPAVAGVAGSMTEEELAASESTVAPKENTKKVGWSQFVQRLPYLAYFEHYHLNFAEFKEKIDAERQASVAEITGADAPPTGKPNPASKVASDASDVSLFGMGVAQNMKGGWVPGTHPNIASNVLLGAAVAFDVLSWLAKDNTDSNIRDQSLNAMRSPSLYLVKFETTANNEEAVYREIVNGQQQISAFGLGCEPAYFHAHVPTTRGYTTPGWHRIRRFVCGYADGEELGFFGNVREPRDLLVYQPLYKPPLVMLSMDKLNRLEHMPRLLGLDKAQMDTAARVMYQKIAPTLDPSWTVVFTAPAADGEWHAYVAREGYVAEYPAVPKR
jgi:hypothetical protein